jgi:hypothetical protein
VDKNAQLAAGYMRGILAEAKKRHAAAARSAAGILKN